MKLIDVYKRYKNSYKNYLSVILKLAMGKKEISVTLRDGTLRNWSEEIVWYYTILTYPREEKLLKILDDYSNSKLSESPIELRYNERGIKLFPNSFDGDFGGFLEIFIGNTYKELLPLEGETVLDVGANIGDSSIYFALNNAEKVIALEPFPETYLTAKKNIEENSLANKITLLNAAYGKDCEVLLDGSASQNGLALLKPSSKGLKVKSHSLETLLNLYNINKAILKMDCEGCEYQILNENISALRKFKRIELEFHYGYRNIENKLRSAGFSTKVLSVSKSGGRDSDLKSMALKNNDYTFGLLYAELI